MRVWLVSSSYPRSPHESINAGVIARDIALDLAKGGHKVTVITPDKPGGVVFDESIDGVRIPWIGASVQLSDVSGRSLRDVIRVASLLMSARVSIPRLVRSRAPEAIIALWGLPSGVFARWGARKAGCPYVVWLLGSDVWRAAQLPMGQRMLTRVLEDAEATFADGRELAQEAERLTGVSVGFLPSVRRLPAAQRVNASSIDVLYVGRYHRNKGPDVLVDSLRLLKQQGRSFHAVLHGSGDLEEALRTRIAQLGLVDYIELFPPIGAHELAERLASARVLVIPSRVESIPLILGDAVQARIPVIATRVGDMSSVVDGLGIGISVPPEDPHALANAIAETLDSPPLILDWSAADRLLSPTGLALRFMETLNVGQSATTSERGKPTRK